MHQPYPVFSWSESKHRRWQECRRKHYWAVYAKHNGWLEGAPTLARLAWRLSKLVPSWSVALGQSVHARAAECIAACRFRRPLPAFARLRRACADSLNGIYSASRHHVAEFCTDPAGWPVLADAYYGKPLDEDELARTAYRLDAAIEQLLASTWLWDAVRRARPEDVVLVDRWYHFALRPNQLNVCAAPDLVLRRAPSEPIEIWDFKVGSVDGVIDQLLTYAVAVRDGLAIPPVGGGYRAGTIHLGPSQTADFRQETDAGAVTWAFEVSQAEVDAAAERIHESARAMRAELADPIRNIPYGPEAYPRTRQRWRCASCEYRGLCEPERYPPEGTT